MSMNEVALALSLFAAMAALQLGGTHGAARGREAAMQPVMLGAPVLFDTARAAEAVAQTVQDLAAAGALDEPDVTATRALGDILGAGQP